MHCFKVLARNIISKKYYSISSDFLQWNEKVKLLSTEEMDNVLEPPKSVAGMKVLDKNAFKKTITVSCLEVKIHQLNDVLKLVKTYLLKLSKIKPVEEIDSERNKILFSPELIKNWTDFNEKTLNAFHNYGIKEEKFSKTSMEIGYENWSLKNLLSAVIPNEDYAGKSFSVIGHIVHLNLKENNLDYKYIIADMLMDKLKNIKTVVCKKNIIENVYRTFEMEVVRGEPNFMVSVQENNCFFEFDFSKVYWNPRLGTEHSRIVEIIKFGDVLFDVFAGVGPFAIPVAKKQCKVFANDLNPDSFNWLNHNIKLNKKSLNHIETFNKDGGDFILTDAKSNLIKIWQDDLFIGKIYFVMNLPAIAPEFMKYFKGLITKKDLVKVDLEIVKKCLPIIHCHFFVSHNNEQKEVFEKMSGMSLDNIEHTFFSVRKVAPSKEMFRITFQLPMEYLVEMNEDSVTHEPPAKKLCTN